MIQEVLYTLSFQHFLFCGEWDLGKGQDGRRNRTPKPQKDDSSTTRRFGSSRRTIMIVAGAAGAVAIGAIIAIFSLVVNASSSPTLQPVPAINGISCDKAEHFDFHGHSHLDIFVDGKSIAVPGNVGILPSNCIYWIHTHSGDGVIHIEAPDNRLMTIGQLFDIWKETASLAQSFPEVPTKTHASSPVVYISGKQAEGDYRDAKIYPNTEIVVVFGKPPTTIPTSYVAGKADLQLTSSARAADVLQKIMAPSTPGSGPLGNDSAPVKIIEFGDYQCNSCGIFHKETQGAVISNLVSTGKAQLLFKDFTLNDNILQPSMGSTLAAEAAYCAGDQGKFWQYHDELYNNQAREGIVWVSKDALKGFASNVALQDIRAFSDCLDSNKYQSTVEQNNALVQELGINATPTFIILGPAEDSNPVKLVGAYPYQAFDIVVKQMIPS
jgi:protein-disulfide isomerase